ncbi:MAG: FMN-binding negative transcriptional regulator [Thaumarchaeota archaeon]|nr:FMN-binding negative transcriptional regulator [Nitrososphaerota archaeon]
MYNPRWFKEDRLQFLHAEIRKIGFGTLVTSAASGMLASHVPLLLDASRGERGLLYGHIARGNLQWRDTLPGSEGLAIFLGPDAYVTPRWYQTKKEDGKVVPTWNYVAIHVRGPVTFFEDPERLREVVTELTTLHESGAEDPWEVTDAPADYIQTQLKSIVGFEMPIARVEGKWKMSQNRPEPDHEGVIAGLDERDQNRDAEVSAEMRSHGQPAG